MGIPGCTGPLYLHIGTFIYWLGSTTVRLEHGVTNGFKIGKILHQNFRVPSFIVKFHAEHIMNKGTLGGGETKVGVRITDGTTLVAEGMEEWTNILLKVERNDYKICCLI